MANVLCVLYDDPVDGYPTSYARGGVPVLKHYPDGQTVPTPGAIDFTPGELLGSGDYNGFIQGCLAAQIAVRNLRKQATPKEVSLKAIVMDKSNYQGYETPMERRTCPTLDSVAAN